MNLEEFGFDDDPAPRLADPKVPIRFVLVEPPAAQQGVGSAAKAAREIKKDFPNAEFHLVGPFDPSPNRITEEEVKTWVEEGTLQHHGMVRDVASLLKQMHVFVPPLAVS